MNNVELFSKKRINALDSGGLKSVGRRCDILLGLYFTYVTSNLR